MKNNCVGAIEGYFISGYADGGGVPVKPLQLVPGAFEEANAFLERHPQTRERFNRVSQFVTGFESPFGLELLATVHWLCRYEQVATAEDAIKVTYAWNQRKSQFTPRQIKLAFNVLKRNDWVAARN